MQQKDNEPRLRDYKTTPEQEKGLEDYEKKWQERVDRLKEQINKPSEARLAAIAFVMWKKAVDEAKKSENLQLPAPIKKNKNKSNKDKKKPNA